MGASRQDRKLRIRVQRKKGRTGVEVIIPNNYSFEVGKGLLQIRSFKGGIVCNYVVFCDDTDRSWIENFRWKVFEQDLLASTSTDFLLLASRFARSHARIYAPTASDLRIRPLARLILGCVYRTRSLNPVSAPLKRKAWSWLRASSSPLSAPVVVSSVLNSLPRAGSHRLCSSLLRHGIP